MRPTPLEEIEEIEEIVAVLNLFTWICSIYFYRVYLKSLKHLFSRYLQSPWEHRKNITARLKLRF
jgi:hypothetical protein